MAPSHPIPGPGPVDASAGAVAELGVAEGGVVPPPAPVTGATVVAVVAGLVVAVVGGFVVAVGAAVVGGAGVDPAKARLIIALSPAASP
jgi:hypothetical protein